MNVLFITSVAVVAADPPESRKLFINALGLPLKGTRWLDEACPWRCSMYG